MIYTLVTVAALVASQPDTPASHLEAMRVAYTDGEIAETITTEVVRDDGTSDAVSATLHIGASDASVRIRYETHDFVFIAHAGSLRGGRQGHARRVLKIDQPGASPQSLLTGHIPTGPLPQLWSPEAGGADITDPSIGLIRFTAASSADGTVELTGESARGPVQLRLDADTHRLIELTATLRDGFLQLRAAPATPLGEDRWTIDTANRRAVDRLDQLAPGSPPLAQREIFPDLTLIDLAGAGADLSEWQADQPDNAQRSPWSLIVFCDATNSDPAGALASGSEALARITTEANGRRVNAEPADRFWLRYRPLLIVVLDENAALSDLPELPPQPGGADVRITTRPDLTIDRLPIARTVAIAIDRDRVIGAMHAIDSDRSADAFVDQMTSPSRRTE